MATAQKTTEETVVNDKRRSRQITNRLKYRLNKRRNLWVRSIGASKSPEKVRILQAKIEAIDFALATLDEA